MKLLLGIAVAIGGYFLVMIVALSAALGGSSATALPGTATRIADIPPEYLSIYREAASNNGIDWAILAAIGSVETDHGRLQGGNCAVSSAGARGPMQFMPGTWASYGDGGDICNPNDAIPAAARYLKASGAPGDYHAAILSYNHAEWYYAKVMAKARAYREAAPAAVVPGKEIAGPVSAAAWLATVPGTNFQCDRRIVASVSSILGRYRAQLTACYAPTGHEASGEHPLGLAVDLVPSAAGTWDDLDRLARVAGWRNSCASTGCASQTGTAFRFVGWDGYPGHGRGSHLHLSWNHGPGFPATSVDVPSFG